MILLSIAYAVYTLITLPGNIKAAQRTPDYGIGYALLVLAAAAFMGVSLIIFMASLGHVAAAWVILIPTIVNFFTGIVIGISNA